MSVNSSTHAGVGPRPIRFGMVGDGEGALTGAVHRMATRPDEHYGFVAGALAASPGKVRRSAAAFGQGPDRAYENFNELVRKEATRPDEIEAVAIVTLTHTYVQVGTAFLETGIHVIRDKPLAARLAEVRRFQELASARLYLFAMTHNYTSFPLVRHARALIATGTLGETCVVQVRAPAELGDRAIGRDGPEACRGARPRAYPFDLSEIQSVVEQRLGLGGGFGVASRSHDHAGQPIPLRCGPTSLGLFHCSLSGLNRENPPVRFVSKSHP